jgi:hypothetical protein
VEVLKLGATMLSADPDRLFRQVGLEGLEAGIGCPEGTWLLFAESGLHNRPVDFWATWVRTGSSEEI